jgi:large subunit ribosomal protein L29
MNIKQLREMNINELKKLIDDKKSDGLKMRFDIAAKQAKNHRGFRVVKKDIAKAMTLIKEMEISK